MLVSTLSRPKAAVVINASEKFVYVMFQHSAARRRLALPLKAVALSVCFNTQPPEGGWIFTNVSSWNVIVSTLSRPKAAVFEFLGVAGRHSFNTQPPEGG